MSYAYATVALREHIPHLPTQELTYRVPDQLRGSVGEGMLVWAPLGRRLLQGVVLALLERPPAQLAGLRDLQGLGDPEAQVPWPQLRLARWLSAYYHTPLPEALDLVLPPGVGQELETTWRATAGGLSVELGTLSEPERAVLYLLRREGEQSESQLRGQLRGADADLRRIYQSLFERGLLARGSRLSTPKVRPQHEWVVDPLIGLAELPAALEALARAPRQAAILSALLERSPEGLPVPLAELQEFGATPQLARQLAQRGYLELLEREIWRDPLAGKRIEPAPPPELTAEQARAWEQLRQLVDSAQHHVALLHGVTGSGKTELYLRAIGRALRQQRQSLVLVPEIALTTQLVRRFAARFPGAVAVLHSRLSLGERYDEWRRLRRGDAMIAIGSRSAVFAPLPKLGLIVVDEEHESSYKHEASPHYHAREVALQLAQISGAVALLGSATPAIESFYAAEQGRYQRLVLRERVGSRLQGGVLRANPIPLPQVKVVDMRGELRAGNRSPFSRALQHSLGQTLERQEQVILFLNRRGSAASMLCRDCGQSVACPRCSVPMVVHEPEQPGTDEPALLRCHYCGHAQLRPENCPQCWSRRIREFGIGTQRVAEEVGALYPQARVLRWDRDVTSRKGSHDGILDAFLQQRADVLVGTQMVAKGLDLPLVTLVGVVAADIGLLVPDFRAAERSFQLLSQVAGRAGRRKAGGFVVIQTYNPEHYAIRAAQDHDYAGFYQEELAFRRAASYPPFTRLVRFVYSHTNPVTCEQMAQELAEQVRQTLGRAGAGHWSLIGPTPAVLQRLRNRHRWQLIVRLADPALLLARLSLPRGWVVDVDPTQLM